MINLMFLKMQISEIEAMAASEKEMKEFIYAGGIRVCGYYEDIEVKYLKRYPKTMEKYFKAKEQWFLMYDRMLPKVEEIRRKDEIRQKADLKNRVEKAEKELKELRKIVDTFK